MRVTADAIKIGFAVGDFDAIKDFVDYNVGDEKKVVNTFVDTINKNGGIDGRTIVPDIKELPPIPGGKPDPLSLCTSWAEGDDVLAVLGGTGPDAQVLAEDGRLLRPDPAGAQQISSPCKGKYAAKAAKSGSEHRGPRQAPRGG